MEDLYNYYAEIAEYVPNLPIFSYTLVRLLMPLMKRLVDIPNVVGLKYSNSNMYELRHVIDLRQQNWTVLSGMDEQCVFATMQGAHGHIGSTLNCMPGVYCQIQDCCKNGKLDRAHELQQYANQVTNVIIAVGFPEALKEVMKMLGFDCGNPRLPSYPISNENQKILHKKLEGSGFSELVEI